MFDCHEEFSKEQIDRIKKIIQTDDFQIINSITHICDLNQAEDSIIKNIKDYIWIYLTNRNSSDFSVKVDEFISFIENYHTIKKPNFTNPSSDGNIHFLKDDYLMICNGHHIYNDFRFLKNMTTNGLYMGESYLGTDHKIYLSKRSMRSKSLGVSSETAKEVDYNSLLAESIFNYFSQPVAHYYLLKTNYNIFNSIFTTNFLNDNQELVHLADLFTEENDDYLDTHTNRFNIIREGLRRRYKKNMSDNDFQRLIDKLQLQFCIQSFMKLLIGPMDDNLGNTAIILTHNGTNVPSIDLAPAYDLDISFNVANELASRNSMHQIMDFNGNPSTIMSLIKEFKDVPGFKEFLNNFVMTIMANNIPKEVINDVYKRTNLSFFKEREDNYTFLLNKRLIEVLDAYKNVYLEATNETILGR